jgi:hypothetical protein
VEQAARVLGTETLKDTVNAALNEVIAAARRRKLIARIEHRTLPVPTPAELARLRAPAVNVGVLSRKRPRR